MKTIVLNVTSLYRDFNYANSRGLPRSKIEIFNRLLSHAVTLRTPELYTSSKLTSVLAGHLIKREVVYDEGVASAACYKAASKFVQVYREFVKDPVGYGNHYITGSELPLNGKVIKSVRVARKRNGNPQFTVFGKEQLLMILELS